MKATATNLLQFLKKSPQFVIPIYQRTYSWWDRECEQLWNDILAAGRNEDVTAHFVGSIVYIEQGLYQVSAQSPLLVIDGQQRLTTITLLLEALARHAGDGEPVDGFTARKIRQYFLLNDLESGEFRYKLLLTQSDKATLLALVEQRELPKDQSVRVVENFQLMQEWIARSSDADIEALCRGLSKLLVVDIALDRDKDNPQLIFESMNSTGRELSQADLIRNFVLMGLEPEHQTRLYEDHWRPMETDFGQEAYTKSFDSFMRHYLTYKTGEPPRVGEVYEAFKRYARSPDKEARDVDSMVAEIHAFAGYYCAMALGKESDSSLAEAFQDLREFKVDVAYPLLLELYHDYRQGVLSAADLEQAVRTIESYVFRRAVCAVPTNSLGKTFAGFARGLDKNRYLETFFAQFMSLPSYRRFPRNDEFARELKSRDMYSFQRRSYWLRRLENFGRKERVPVDEYTIEHIMPQNPDLSAAWRDALGPDWERVHETYLHTLGNLTLTGYNSEYSDKPFEAKRDMDGGFRVSPLHLNEGLGAVDVWNEESIKGRADRLAKRALEVWWAPTVAPEVLEKYRPKSAERRATYSIDDHVHLGPTSAMRPVFDALREQILALDPVVVEEFLKQYVAFKAETNFVDVVAKKGYLKLTLNMDFYDLNDPHGRAVDVSAIGRWGNGGVGLDLASRDDIPYAMGLIRQSFEKQMGGDDSLF